ncbi:MAG: NAD-dependent succinate-semialdehyde dehydrogenase [Actinobacteria bacterium]|nr:NAD-dependent succinate-semialdehyde dehydrogenase [Actinomycetota bacterium]
MSAGRPAPDAAGVSSSLRGSRSSVAAIEAAVAAVPKLLLIGGEWRAAAGGRELGVEDPATGRELCRVADAPPGDGVAALAAAAEAQAEWARWAPRRRGEILRRAYEEVVARREELARLMTLEMGKPLAESLGEVSYAADFLLWFSEEAVRIGGDYALAPDGGSRLLVSRRPVGPCLLITPWNFPLAMGARKIGPAIAAGCTMVVKPASQTPLSMLALADVLERAGLPAGVLNVVVTSESGAVMEPLIRDGRARKLSFTGSTEVGRVLAGQASEQLLRLSMELGGNAPFIVFADADVDAAVEGAVLAKMRNGGEACTAANRFHVANSVRAEFGEKLTAKIRAMRVGPGYEEGVEVGPLIDATQRAKVAELVDDAVGLGAEVLTGGGAIDGPGHFFAPTVLDEVPPSARLLDEEIFGPVAPVLGFDDPEEAIVAANRTEYGLVAYLYTRDLDRALGTLEKLQTGMVGVNRGLVSNPAAPFGGVKASGYGREGGGEGIEEYLDLQYAAIAR